MSKCAERKRGGARKKKRQMTPRCVASAAQRGGRIGARRGEWKALGVRAGAKRDDARDGDGETRQRRGRERGARDAKFPRRAGGEIGWMDVLACPRRLSRPVVERNARLAHFLSFARVSRSRSRLAPS